VLANAPWANYAEAVQLGGHSGNSLSIRVTGYQFPDADDPRERYSWHMVAGEARCSRGEWSFRMAALTYDESPQVSAWLREVAGWCETRSQDGTERPTIAPLSFTEPNLAFRIGDSTANALLVEVDLDLEFQPPWHRRRGAGDPFTLTVATDPDQLRRAAAEWDLERSPFPDGLP
jgi:hypothetical protein